MIQSDTEKRHAYDQHAIHYADKKHIYEGTLLFLNPLSF